MLNEPRKLQIAMIPAPLWNFNLREFLTEHRWRKLRNAAVDKHGAFCQTCGKDVSAPRAAHGHEVWEYDTACTPAIARLIGIEIACWHCHMAEHWGRLQTLAATLPRAIPDTIEHYCRVNRCTREDLEEDKKRASAEWRRLSALCWEVDWGDYADMLLDIYVELPSLSWRQIVSEKAE